MHQEMKPVENIFVNPSGITQNPPKLFNLSFSMPTIKKEMNFAIANLKKKCNAEVHKRKEVNAGIEKAQT